MSITLSDVEVVVAPAVLPVVTLPPRPVTVTTPVAAPTVTALPPALPSIATGAFPSTSGAVVVALAGPEGPRGPAGGEVFDYQMPVAQTTAVVAHPLGRDPVSVQVLLDGQTCSEFEVVFTIPGEQVRVGFDIPIAALIRLI